MVVVDDLDKRLNLGALRNLRLRHAASNLLRVTLDASDESVGEAVSLGATINRRDDDNPSEI